MFSLSFVSRFSKISSLVFSDPLFFLVAYCLASTCLCFWNFFLVVDPFCQSGSFGAFNLFKFKVIINTYVYFINCFSVQFSCSVVSDSLWPHESQHARLPYPSPAPGVYWDSCPSSRWCHPAISSSVVPFSWPQSLPASGSFPMSQLFAWGGQSTGVSVSASVLSVNTQDWSPLDLL